MGRRKITASRTWWKGFFDREFYTPAGPPQLEAAGREVRFVIRALGLRKGAPVLDLCCGPARHSVLLAKKGMRVTGLDYSAAYLKEARARARGMKVPARFIKGDMKKLAFRAEFDAVINLFTSFGYFRRQSDNLRVLRGVARALRPGGLFLMDVVNRDYLVRVFQARGWMPLGKGYLLEERRFTADKRRIVNRWIRIFPDGRKMERSHDLHIYDWRSLSALLRRAGLKPVRFWGDFKGGPLSPRTNRMIALARKPAR